MSDTYIPFARKYRPQLFSELAGQDAIAETLKNAVESGQAARAYLFFGPRGVGKTTTARILAKALNCAKGPTPKPCGACDSCREIAEGRSIDVLELDAASHTQVDKIREMIIETVSLAPSRDRFKVFIIDEVHMLSTSSFNALLKTLEEPPAHAVFILATTELGKIPATIVSRCQRFRFRPLSVEGLAEHLGRLAKAEKLQAEPKALRLLAKAAGGSLRDAVSLLDQAAAFGEGKVGEAGVIELMGALPEEALLELAKALLAKDAPALGRSLGSLFGEGHDPGQLLRDLRERLQAMYLARLGVAKAEEPWGGLSAEHSAEAFAFLLRRVQKALEDMRFADAPQTVCELALYGMLESTYDLAAWVARLEALEKRLGPGAAEVTDGTAGAVASAAPVLEKAPPVSGKTARPALEDATGARRTGAAKAAPAPAKPTAPVSGLWARFLAAIEEARPALSGCLRACRLDDSKEPWSLVFSRAFELEQAQDELAFLEGELSKAAGKPVRLKLSSEAPAPKAEEEGWEDASKGDALAEDLGVRKVLDVFGGKAKPAAKKPKGAA